MKRIAPFAIAIILLISSAANATGLLPSLTDAYGVPMPSLGDVLNRYPDTETKEVDGSTVQLWNNVTNEGFETFSNYLSTAGVMLLDYTVTNGVFTTKIGKNESYFIFSYDSHNQTAKVIYPKGIYDKRIYEAESHYHIAKQLMEQKQYAEALNEFKKIRDYSSYKDVDHLLKSDENLLAAAAYKAKMELYRTIGSVVTFGQYEQGDKEEKYLKPIEWIVLDTQENKSLLISKFELEKKAFDEEHTRVTWEICTLRSWLNGEFLQKAFNSEEQRAILTTSVNNSASQCYTRWNTDGGNDTRDKIFLLSYTEAKKYFGISKINSRYVDILGWWLRSPGNNQHYAAYVGWDSGALNSNVTFINNGVRPALWINLESNIF